MSDKITYTVLKKYPEYLLKTVESYGPDVGSYWDTERGYVYFPKKSKDGKYTIFYFIVDSKNKRVISHVKYPNPEDTLVEAVSTTILDIKNQEEFFGETFNENK